MFSYEILCRQIPLGSIPHKTLMAHLVLSACHPLLSAEYLMEVVVNNISPRVDSEHLGQFKSLLAHAMVYISDESLHHSRRIYKISHQEMETSKTEFVKPVNKSFNNSTPELPSMNSWSTPMQAGTSYLFSDLFRPFRVFNYGFNKENCPFRIHVSHFH